MSRGPPNPFLLLDSKAHVREAMSDTERDRAVNEGTAAIMRQFRVRVEFTPDGWAALEKEVRGVVETIEAAAYSAGHQDGIEADDGDPR